MGGVVSKTANSLPKVLLSSWIILIPWNCSKLCNDGLWHSKLTVHRGTEVAMKFACFKSTLKAHPQNLGLVQIEQSLPSLYFISKLEKDALHPSLSPPSTQKIICGAHVIKFVLLSWTMGCRSVMSYIVFWSCLDTLVLVVYIQLRC